MLGKYTQAIIISREAFYNFFDNLGIDLNLTKKVNLEVAQHFSYKSILNFALACHHQNPTLSLSNNNTESAKELLKSMSPVSEEMENLTLLKINHLMEIQDIGLSVDSLAKPMVDLSTMS